MQNEKQNISQILERYYILWFGDMKIEHELFLKYIQYLWFSAIDFYNIKHILCVDNLFYLLLKNINEI